MSEYREGKCPTVSWRLKAHLEMSLLKAEGQWRSTGAQNSQVTAMCEVKKESDKLCCYWLVEWHKHDVLSAALHNYWVQEVSTGQVSFSTYSNTFYLFGSPETV